MRVKKSNPQYAELVASSLIHFSIKDYGYFFTRQEWEDIPFMNQQPAFNPVSEYLEVEMEETANGLRRKWVVQNTPIEELMTEP